MGCEPKAGTSVPCPARLVSQPPLLPTFQTGVCKERPHQKWPFEAVGKGMKRGKKAKIKPSVLSAQEIQTGTEAWMCAVGFLPFAFPYLCVAILLCVDN